jgi:DNA polymerase III subunit delta
MKNVYVLLGTETYLLEKKKEEILHKCLSSDEIEFGVSVHDARETAIQDAIDDCLTISFLGGNRVVIVKDCYFLTTEKAKEKIEHDLDRLQSYFDHPVQETSLILMVPYEKMDNRKKLVKNIKKTAVLHEVKPLKGGQLFDWVYSHSKLEGITMSTDAINLLISFIGSNLYQLEQEIKKMSLYIGKGNELNVSHVEMLVSKTLEQDIFKLINSIVDKDLSLAFELLEDMIRQGEDAIKIINLIARQFRIIFQLKELQKQGLSNNEMATKLKLHPYVVSINNSMADRYESAYLLGILTQLSDLDYRMKTGQVEKELALQTFLTQIV